MNNAVKHSQTIYIDLRTDAFCRNLDIHNID